MTALHDFNRVLWVVTVNAKKSLHFALSSTSTLPLLYTFDVIGHLQIKETDSYFIGDATHQDLNHTDFNIKKTWRTLDIKDTLTYSFEKLGGVN